MRWFIVERNDPDADRVKEGYYELVPLRLYAVVAQSSRALPWFRDLLCNALNSEMGLIKVELTTKQKGNITELQCAIAFMQ